MKSVISLIIVIVLFGCERKLLDSENSELSVCDSSYSVLDTLTNTLSFYCIKNGLLERTDTEFNGDTSLILKELSQEVFSKTYFIDKEVINRNLLVRFGERENVTLSLFYKNGILDTLESVFFWSKFRNDSLFLKYNNPQSYGGKSDSIWLSDYISYFPSIKEVFDVNYVLKTTDPETWLYINKQLLNNSKCLVLNFSDHTTADGLSGVLFGPCYIDNTIIEWNQEFVSNYIEL